MTTLPGVAIERLRTVYLPEVAQFHAQNLGGKLTGLGPDYIRYFYNTALKLEGTFGWIALQKNAVAGFVFGSTLSDALVRRVIEKRPIGWVVNSARSLMRHPLRSFSVARSFFQEASPAQRPDQAELHYIAVRADLRGQHVGRELMAHFCKELTARGRTYFGLSVGENNLEAIRFYETNGGQVLGHYRSAGTTMRRFLFDARKFTD